MTGEHDRFVAHSLRTSMYFAPSQLFIAGNPKAAGTSLRWWLLSVHGVDVEARTATSLWGESAPYQVVWDEAADLSFAWSDLSETDRAKALTAAEVLTVKPVRHPVTRAFSAWAGKYLTMEAYYHDRLPEGFPAPPETIESARHIKQLFEQFMASLAEVAHDNQDWIGIDVHFWPQHRLLAREVAGSELLLRQESMKPGLDRILEQLSSHGIDAQPMPRLNENVVPYQPELVSKEALRLLEQIYQADFAHFGYQVEAPSGGKQKLDLMWLNDLRGRNRRYRVVHEAATRNLSRVSELSDELEEARRRQREILTSHSWKLTAPLRAATGRFRGSKAPTE